MFKIKVRIWVILPLDWLVNQFAEILAWQFRINGLPMPAKICPTMTHANELLTSNLKLIPRIPKKLPIIIPVLVP